jgi:hypothetical protein
MSLHEKTLCTGPSGCGHPRHEHTGTHVKGSRTACRHKLAQGRGVCACTEFKGVRTDSPVSKRTPEAARG